MFKISRFSKLKISILLILIISASLRFYNLPNSFIFAGDEEYQATLAQSLVKDFHIIWVGVNAAHLGFYLGPYWTYFSAFWLWLSQGNPLITGYVSSAIGVLTTLLIILTGSSLFGRKTGLFAGLLYATLPLMVFFDQKYWNPTLIPLLSLLLLLSLFKTKQNPGWLILFAASYGLVFHTHLSLIPVIFIAGYWLVRQKIRPSGKIILLSLATFLIMLAPLIAFDYFHKGSNITTPLRYKEITADYRNQVNPGQHLPALFQVLGRVWFIQAPSVNADEVITSCTDSSRIGNPKVAGISQRFTPPVWLSLIGLAFLLLFLINRKTWKKDAHTLLALFLITLMAAFLLFPGGAFEYYLLGVFPLLMFLPGILTDYFTRFKPTIILVVFLAAILGTYTVLTNKPEFGLGVKNSLIKQVITYINNEPFELKQTGLCHFYEGWRYLFIVNGKKPERSDSDQGMGWLYQSEITNKPIKYTVIFSESRVPVSFDTKDATILKSGGFTTYIFKTQ
ncbi:glycosyltransferase family 39 protein [Candidatus Daviesbacteria bacterium]|nr:glycosyltransferase family 39 protein [Candidatus Daviesbacteria bacterium]